MMYRYGRGCRAEGTWSAQLTTDVPLSCHDIIHERLAPLLAQHHADPQKPICGIILAGSGQEEQLRSQIILGLDPSRTWGTPTSQTCDALVADICQRLGWKRVDHHEPPLDEFRIIMGRRVGYDRAAYTYSMEEVETLIQTHDLGDAGLQCLAGDLFSLRYVHGNVRTYHEPSVLIQGPYCAVEKVLRVAGDMRQERCVVERTGIETQVYERQPCTETD
jgi:hypothetical protein